MSDIIEGKAKLQTPWQTVDPFLFCMHHDDDYPSGNDQMGPDASLAGRSLGHDFSGKDGWSMYHGESVPGFPGHPHCGFETITLARDGYIDHSDSLGAAARFGAGDVQWMTAGNGVVHAEMFPLVNRDDGNHTELLQIWLNLPSEDKAKDPYFTMLWNEEIPRTTFTDDAGRSSELVAIAGRVAGMEPPSAPPSSWASREESAVAVWTLTMEPGAEFELPAGDPEANRVLYFFDGNDCTVAGQTIDSGQAIQVRSDAACTFLNGDTLSEFVVLQGRPIGEPVVKQGPFVANTRGEIRDAMLRYRETGFGGWPWESDDPVHPRDRGRFARHVDGTEEYPDSDG